MATSSGLFLSTIYNQSQLAERKHVARYWSTNTAATAVPLSAHLSPLAITTKLAAAILGGGLFWGGVLPAQYCGMNFWAKRSTLECLWVLKARHARDRIAFRSVDISVVTDEAPPRPHMYDNMCIVVDTLYVHMHDVHVLSRKHRFSRLYHVLKVQIRSQMSRFQSDILHRLRTVNVV